MHFRLIDSQRVSCCAVLYGLFLHPLNSSTLCASYTEDLQKLQRLREEIPWVNAGLN